jgi:hypothetical protein
MSKFRRQLMMANMSEPAPPAPVLPYDAEVEYLESTGTQYIDTGCQINFNGNVAMEQQVTIAYTVTNVRQLNGSNGFGFWGCTKGNKFECAGGSNTASSVSVGTDYHDVSFSYKKENGKGHTTLYVDDVKARDVANSTISNSYDYDIFIYAIGGYNHAAAQLFSKAKIKSYKLLFDGVAVRDYIPVRKDGVGYLYDRVSGQLFGNAGTENFNYGNDKT